MKKSLTYLVLAAVTMLVLSVTGCGESQSEKYYRQQNEDRKKIEEINRKAAEGVQNQKFDHKPFKAK